MLEFTKQSQFSKILLLKHREAPFIVVGGGTLTSVLSRPEGVPEFVEGFVGGPALSALVVM